MTPTNDERFLRRVDNSSGYKTTFGAGCSIVRRR